MTTTNETNETNETNANKSESTANTNQHVLYKETKNKIHNGKIVKYTKYELYLASFQGCENEHEELEFVHELRKGKPLDECHVVINSPGGCTDAGFLLIDTLTNSFNKRIVTEIGYHASSMGSLMFAIGDDKRIISKNSRLMMHDYSTGYWSIKASDLKSHFEFGDKHIHDLMFDLYCVQNKFLTKKEFKQMLAGKEFWFNTEEMVKRKICTHVWDQGVLRTRKEYKKLHNIKN